MAKVGHLVSDALRTAAADVPGLSLLVLHGSRARGDAHAGSDWDFAYRGDTGFDPDALLAQLADHLRADRIDLVDLDRAGALIRFRVARDGVVIVEHERGAFERFQLAAVDTWCDLAPVLEPAYERVLHRVER
jgi:predicted nucleotidyltransferase